MRKKTLITTIAIVVAGGIILGLILFSSGGDGPVMSVIVSDEAIENVQDYEETKSSPDGRIYLVLEYEFNKLNENSKAVIPANKDLYANIHFVEIEKGTKYTARWIVDGKILKEDTKEMLTDQQGVLYFLLEGNYVKSRNFILELYDMDEKIFEHEFSID